MLRIRLIGLLWGAICWPAMAHASNYGFSINVNFAADGQRITGPAGLFSERIWNGFDEPSSDQQPLDIDSFGQLSRSAATVRWDSRGVEILDSVKPRNPNDGIMMRGFLDSPTSIVLENLDLVVPSEQSLSYALLIYTAGGRPGELGQFIVNGISRDHRDSGVFDGAFRTGIDGNVVIFEDLTAPQLEIKTDGFGAMNAISLMYCRSGDFNGDGQVDVSDLDELSEALKQTPPDIKFDVNLDLQVTFADVLAWIKWSKGTCIGDVNLDGVFDSTDLIQLFQQGIYESDETATWTSGDWNGDGKFDSSDLLAAFQEGCYEAEGRFANGEADSAPSSAWLTVPEPAVPALLWCFLPVWLRRAARNSRIFNVQHDPNGLDSKSGGRCVAGERRFVQNGTRPSSPRVAAGASEDESTGARRGRSKDADPRDRGGIRASSLAWRPRQPPGNSEPAPRVDARAGGRANA